MNEQQKQNELLDRIYQCIPRDNRDKLDKIIDLLWDIKMKIKYSVTDMLYNGCIIGLLYQILITLQEISTKL
jgi:uncharacterized protein YpuA (DUF1002 family)